MAGKDTNAHADSEPATVEVESLQAMDPEMRKIITIDLKYALPADTGEFRAVQRETYGPSMREFFHHLALYIHEGWRNRQEFVDSTPFDDYGSWPAVEQRESGRARAVSKASD